MERSRAHANSADVSQVGSSRVVDASRERAAMVVEKNVEKDE